MNYIPILNNVLPICGPWEYNHGMLGAQCDYKSSHGYIAMVQKRKAWREVILCRVHLDPLIMGLIFFVKNP
jgi:hypothetical protein